MDVREAIYYLKVEMHLQKQQCAYYKIQGDLGGISLCQNIADAIETILNIVSEELNMKD